MSHAAPCGADVSQNAVDRDTSHRQTLYAAQEPQRKEAALDRWFALFGIVRKTSTSS